MDKKTNKERTNAQTENMGTTKKRKESNKMISREEARDILLSMGLSRNQFEALELLYNQPQPTSKEVEEALKLFDTYGEEPVFRTNNIKMGLPVDELDSEKWDKIREYFTKLKEYSEKDIAMYNTKINKLHGDNCELKARLQSQANELYNKLKSQSNVINEIRNLIESKYVIVDNEIIGQGYIKPDKIKQIIDKYKEGKNDIKRTNRTPRKI